jgi:hypothetical protein
MTMTSTMCVHLAKLEEQTRAAARAGDIPRMQLLVGEQQRLLESVYGCPLAR